MTYSELNGVARQFEFVLPGNQPVSRTAAPIEIDGTETPETLADLIEAAVNMSDLSLDARALEDGRIFLGGESGDTVDIQSDGLTLLGTPGLTDSLTLTVPAAETGASVSGQTVTVTVGPDTRTFLLTTDSSVVTSDIIVLLTRATTPRKLRPR